MKRIHLVVGIGALSAVLAAAGGALAFHDGDPGLAPGNLEVVLNSAPTLPDVPGQAVWDPETRTLTYSFVHSGSCPPTEAAANIATGGEVTLVIATRKTEHDACTADAHPADAVISGLDAFPQELNVTEGDRPTETVPVDVPAPLMLTCPDDSRTQMFVDFAGPPRGPSTPEELVAQASTPEQRWVLSGSTRAYALRPDGTAFQVREIRGGPDGYAFGGYTGCAE